MPAQADLEAQAERANLLIGWSCSQVSLGVADSLILDFGELEQNAGGQLAGDFALAIDCPWRIDGPDMPVVGWEDDEEDIAYLASVVIGLAVVDIDVRRPGFDLAVDFSNDHRLRVFPDCRAYFRADLPGGALPWQVASRNPAGLSPAGL